MIRRIPKNKVCDLLYDVGKELRDYDPDTPAFSIEDFGAAVAFALLARVSWVEHDFNECRKLETDLAEGMEQGAQAYFELQRAPDDSRLLSRTH